MVNTEKVIGESSRRGKNKRTGYTEEQLRALERIYDVCSNPNRFQLPQILRENPILRGIDDKQLKVWFQNRRCREKHRQENQLLQRENERLANQNKALREKNDDLTKKIGSTNSATDSRPPAEANALPLSIITENNTWLMLQAEDAKAEFLSKAIGTTIDWTPIPMMKFPHSNPLGTRAVYVSNSCVGMAARACTVVPFEPLKTIEILKDRPSWSRDCKSLEVMAKYAASNGGTIELIYTKYYALTPMAFARDFWTLRYTSILEDGNIVVCEKSVSESSDIPSSPVALEFVRGKRLASGYLIRQVEGGSSIEFVDHLDLEASLVPQMVRSRYESSEYLAHNLYSAIEHLEDLTNEKNRIQPSLYGPTPDQIRSYSQRLSRGFNDGLNGCSEDGWTLINESSSDDNIIMSIKRIEDPGNDANYDGIICVQSSLILENVLPWKLVKFLKEQKFSWMSFEFPEISLAFPKVGCFPFPKLNVHKLAESSAVLGKTNRGDEVVQAVQFERLAHQLLNPTTTDLHHLQISSGLDEDTSFYGSSELIFAPIHRALPDDSPLSSSGFRVLSLGSNTGEGSSSAPMENKQIGRSVMLLVFQFPSVTHLQEDVQAMAKQYIQHVISCVKNICHELAPQGTVLEVNTYSVGMEITPSSNPTEPDPSIQLGVTPNQDNVNDTNPLMDLEITPDFGVNIVEEDQGPNSNPGMNSGETFSGTVQEIMQDAIFSMDPVESMPVPEIEIDPNLNYITNPNPEVGIEMNPDQTYAFLLTNLMCQSYRSFLGIDLLGFNHQLVDSVFQRIQYHPYAIICFSLWPIPVSLYANQTALLMLETTMENFMSNSVTTIIGGCNAAIVAAIPTVINQGYAILPFGYFLSVTNHLITYEQALVWQVLAPDGSFHCLALAFTKWSST